MNGRYFTVPYGISCRVPGIGSSIEPFCRLLCAGTIASPLAFSTRVALSSLVRERWPMAMIMGVLVRHANTSHYRDPHSKEGDHPASTHGPFEQQ
jgi:hypothetical protein